MKKPLEEALTNQILSKFPHINLQEPLLAQFDSINAVKVLLELEKISGSKMDFLRHNLNQVTIQSLLESFASKN